ncbi:unnamed protein product [Alternaria alternata]
MRLLNTSTLQVEEFLQSQVPDYVILSHTWGSEEVTLQDILSNVAPSKKGFAKLIGCCKRAKDDGFKYCWIDTCCIDKTSSAELSEAINSMYQWYKGACICYAYLEDVQGNPQLDDYKAFSKSRWFTRGWTLQELIAPGIVEFYNVSWVDIGTRSSLQKRLTGITGINEKILTGGNPLNCPVAVRMSWAARRETSRVEDQAYCLLGIFGVNMALLYGEGHRAFLRLQEEILRIDEDYTLFAWDVNSSTGSLLANLDFPYGLEGEPCFTAELKMAGKRGSIPKTVQGLDISNASDRATLQVRDATTGGDKALHIKIAMRRVAALAIAPNSRHFVLILSEEHMMK